MASIYERCVEKWGVEQQFDIAVEEMAECIVAIQHARRNRPSNLPEEVADLEITTEQLRSIVGGEAVAVFKEQKLARLERRLATGEFNG